MQGDPHFILIQNPDPIFTEQEAANYLRISQSTMRRKRKAGIGPDFMRDGNLIRYRRSELDRYVSSHTKSAAPKAAA